MFIDHVILGVADPEATAARLREEHGLGSVPGGRHAALGTRNVIVPLEPPAYFELLTPEDTSKPLAAMLAAAIADGDRLVTWAVGGIDIEAVGERLSISPESGSIENDRGGGSWRTVQGMPLLPFFIAYDGDRRPSRERLEQADHQYDVGGFAWLEIGGDEAELREWLGEGSEALPLRFVGDAPGVHAVAIESSGGEIVIR